MTQQNHYVQEPALRLQKFKTETMLLFLNNKAMEHNLLKQFVNQSMMIRDKASVQFKGDMALTLPRAESIGEKIIALNREIRSLKGELERLENENAAQKDAIDFLRGSNEVYQKKCALQEEDIKKLKSQNSMWKETCESNNTIRALQKTIDYLNDLVHKCLNLHPSVDSIVKTQEGAMFFLNSASEIQTKENQSLKSKIGNWYGELSQYISEHPDDADILQKIQDEMLHLMGNESIAYF